MIVLLFVTFEVILHFMNKSGHLDIRRPIYVSQRYWGDIDEHFGMWHYSNSSYRHTKKCFDVRYTSNSYGARDAERIKQGPQRRVAAIGDSMIEGFGLEDKDRLTNMLEKETGIEHLNFGVSQSFGPVQYMLLYKHLASEFTHDAVIIGLLPDNDFTDVSYDYWMKYSTDRYRPYLTGEYPDYSLKYSSASTGLIFRLQVFLSDYTYSYNAVRSFYRMYLMKSPQKRPSSKSYSGYYDFNERQLQMVFYSLEEIAKMAQGKEVIVLVIPRLEDLQRFRAEGTPPLRARLEELSKKSGIIVLDLLDYLASDPNIWEKYYLSCDGHLSAYGSDKIARYMIGALGYYKGDRSDIKSRNGANTISPLSH